MKTKYTLLLLLCLITIQNSRSQTHVSGTIIGETWTQSGSPYIVDSSIFVASLTIEPGVIITFSGKNTFEVGGVLTAIGSPCDSIVFTQDDSIIDRWQGLYFSYSAPGSEIAFCKIEKAANHGILIENSSPIIRNCLIQNNHIDLSGTAKGGGVYCIGDITLTDCCIRNNSTYSHIGFTIPQYGYGGGICAEGNLTLNRCTISNNTTSASATWATGRTYGGGIYVNGALFMNNSVLNGNTSNGGGAQGGINDGYGYGGGLFISGTGYVYNSIISYNSVAGYNGRICGGIYCSFLYPSQIYNCTVAYNDHEGVYADNIPAKVKNSIVYFNDYSLEGNCIATYCDVQGGYNGTGNIDYNPVFLSSNELVIVQGSPCIDAGDSLSDYDDACFPPSLGGSRNDVGAHGSAMACGWLEGLFPMSVSATIIDANGSNNGSITLLITGGTPPYNTIWTGPGGFTSNNQDINNLFAGCYILSYGDAFCNHTDSFYVEGTTGLNTAIQKNEIVVYPNPTQDKAIVRFSSTLSEPCKLTVLDLAGRELIVRNESAVPGKNEFSLDLYQFVSGIYIVKLQNSTVEMMQKIFKE